MNATLIALCVCGLVLHFLGRYSEYCKSKERISPWAYVRQDLAGWLAAVIGSVVCMLLLPDMPALLGISAPDIGSSGL